MANLIVNTLRVTGPAEDRDRLKAAIETSAIDHGEGVECLRTFVIEWEKWTAAFPEWGDITPLGTIESSYSYEHLNPGALRPIHVTKDDMRPVRTVKDVLIVKTVSNWNPPIAFVERLGKLLPRLEVNGSSLDLANGDLKRWQSHAGETELLERQYSVFLCEETFEWEKQGKVWMWVGERDADIEMLRAFLSLECGAADPAELHNACRLAYDALAFPEKTLPSRANNYAYCLAGTIAEYRHSLIIAGENPHAATEYLNGVKTPEEIKADIARREAEPKAEPGGPPENDFFGTLKRLRAKETER